MERKGLRKKDVLRMDGLLPPTRRVPVCDAVTSAPEKKKDKKWSIGGILRRISSIRDYDSSSNDEEIVYCKRTPRKPIKLNGQPNDVVLHSIENNSEYDKRIRVENNIRHLTDSPHSRGSDGSLDGFGRKTRKNKLKARAEAKRDHLCADSSSDEDCRKSTNSLNRSHGVDGAQNGLRINALACNRKTRAARTERYIKRLSRDESNDSIDTLNELHNKRSPSEYIEDKERNVYADTNGFCRPPIHPRRIGVNSHSRVFPVQKHSIENLRDVDRAGLPDPEILSDYRRYSTGQYVTDLNQNNTYGKISRNVSKDAYADNHRIGNFFTYPTKNACHYPESYAYTVNRQLINLDNQPPEPPPRDPRCRMFRYGYGSYPTRRHQNVPNFFKQEDNKINVVNGILKPDRRNFRSYGSNNEIAWRDTVDYELKNSMSNLNPELRNSLERINNKYNSSRHCVNESVYEETEASRCRRRNIRNDQLNCSDVNYSAYKVKNKSANICESNKHHEMISSHASAASSDWSSARSPCEQRISRSVTPTTYDVDCTEKNKMDDNRRMTPTEEALERRRSSKNLEEALSELEAIYNSLRLGDEDLLDRAERRSMEEFNLKQSKNELNAINVVAPDSPDRTKDDMAYRRMHPKERPTSLSDIAGQSTLSNISYLIASPVLTRRDSGDDFARASSTYPSYPSRRDEPDVTRDDVVFRSMNHANNTLRVIDPQPPFGIPLGPVTAATESDYLHTTPTKPEQPRSPYIPQCEPDVVTDDLAYRSLRKDAVAARIVADNKIDFSKEQPVDGTCGMKKKRAVRSLSANLYGLINHDRIHLRRESNLDDIKDEIYNQERVTRNSVATSERPGYLRRVMSDGELSENDTRKRKESVIRSDIDINGNHPMVGAYRKKLCVYVSPEATMTRGSSKKEKAEVSDAMLSSKTVLDDKFWHEYLRSDSNVSAANSGCSTETDFIAYSRLCQDLVNLIKGDDDDAAPSIEPPNTDDPVVVNVTQPDKSDDFDIELEVDEPPAGIRSLDRHYSGSRRAAHANDEENVENENAESPITFSTTNSADPSSESAPASNLDFYLRMADENVKIIAEAFGNVADRLCDSHLLVPKNSSSHSSEIETQSGSTRSSTLYSQDEEEKNVDRLVVSSKLAEATRGSSKRNSLTSNEGDQYDASHFENVSIADAELDLSRAVHDLQLAAASLCEHEREIEDLGIGRGKVDEHIHNVTPTTVVFCTDEEEDEPICKISLITDGLKQEQECDQEENVALPSEIKTQNDMRNEGNRESERIAVCELDCIESCYVKDDAQIHNVTPTTAAFSTDEEEDKPICEISLIADALKQEQEHEQEGNIAPPNGIETRSDVRSEGSREGERTVCELDRIESWYVEGDAQSASGMRFPCVTNLITVTVTTYSMLLLACLVALLLAIVAAS